MKNKLALGLLSLIAIIFSGCSSRGYVTANHNGKMYWNPGNCNQYRYYNSNPDNLHCMKDGVETGQILTPASSSQIQAYYQKQQADQQAWDSLNRSIQENNRNMQLQNQNLQLQMLNNNLNGLRYGY